MARRGPPSRSIDRTYAPQPESATSQTGTFPGAATPRPIRRSVDCRVRRWQTADRASQGRAPKWKYCRCCGIVHIAVAGRTEKIKKMASWWRHAPCPGNHQMGETQAAQDRGGCVLAAIDLSSSSRRVLLHAAGLARLLSTPLKVLHVGKDVSLQQRKNVMDYCALQGPYEVDLCASDTSCGPGLCPRRSIVKPQNKRRV